MSGTRLRIALLAMALVVLLVWAGPQVLARWSVARAPALPPPDDVAAALVVPPGFRVALFAEVPNARGLARGEGGTIFVGSMRAGLVHAVTDEDGDGVADRVRVLARDLRLPVGLDLWQGDLYVSANDRILRLPAIEDHLDDPPAPEVVVADLPAEPHHGWRYLRFGPDGRLWVPVGAPCNVCASDDPVFASILRMDPDGSHREIVAHGVRNTVGFDWDPRSGDLWFTDNGRDWLGDDLPPCELNHLVTAGQHFGFPHCHGTAVVDPDLPPADGCEAYVPPVQDLGAHVAPLGMRFAARTGFPAPWRDGILVAEHGSWNRTRPAGYRVSWVGLDADGRATAYEPFLTG
ncbi:MAG: PQQ-dependent sugar dehydrogenase, partial [Alphaproteobacteria bacterium]|nr:PQQ-dependent sugar dehydrogenase [Alphaproteobacteria bacterium]